MATARGLFVFVALLVLVPGRSPLPARQLAIDSKLSLLAKTGFGDCADDLQGKTR